MLWSVEYHGKEKIVEARWGCRTMEKKMKAWALGTNVGNGAAEEAEEEGERKKEWGLLLGRRNWSAGRLGGKPCEKYQLFPWLAYPGNELSVSYIGTQHRGCSYVPPKSIWIADVGSILEKSDQTKKTEIESYIVIDSLFSSEMSTPWGQRIV